ncbi:hypothetical protein FIU88_19020 (plasmid) [Halomonas sp. THAF12]|uniref:hypothetical protein n=1 Tax=Halomonas sp. THAF12 TaxID=2587849 RepID=UPI001268315A|nr:hypothetical protein [Halomonas sp. THAF12]QFT86804.1 hypothetical protein FIU88_17805 [Halomonas sp. THAF12]QFT87047.1 hypothetical protein FIU88_19020 [Halomonas sp. THAF12]
MAAPSKKPGSKGLPPQPTQTAHVVGNHTSKPEAGATVPCNFRVDPEFKKRLKTFAATHDMSMVEVFETAVNEYMERKGGA